MGNLTAEENSQVITGKQFTNTEIFGQKQYLPTPQDAGTNEDRIIKRRKLKSRFRAKV